MACVLIHVFLCPTVFLDCKIWIVENKVSNKHGLNVAFYFWFISECAIVIFTWQDTVYSYMDHFLIITANILMVITNAYQDIGGEFW